MHPDKLEAPSLFSVDPDASLRARSRWQTAYGKRVIPLQTLSESERSEKRASAVIGFLQKDATKRRFSGDPLAMASAAASAEADAEEARAAARAGGATEDMVVEPFEPPPAPAPAPEPAPPDAVVEDA